MSTDVSYKFCIISFVSGSRGALLGHLLLNNYPQNFSAQRVTKQPAEIFGGHDTWHTFTPHFAEEIFSAHPFVQLDNLWLSTSATKLHPEKYNIILTHLYTDSELQQLRVALGNQHIIKKIQITYTQSEIEHIAQRATDILPAMGHVIPNNLYNNTATWLTRVTEKKTHRPVATVPWSSLKDSGQPPDLAYLMEHFEL